MQSTRTFGSVWSRARTDQLTALEPHHDATDSQPRGVRRRQRRRRVFGPFLRCTTRPPSGVYATFTTMRSFRPPAAPTRATPVSVSGSVRLVVATRGAMRSWKAPLSTRAETVAMVSMGEHGCLGLAQMSATSDPGDSASGGGVSTVITVGASNEDEYVVL